MYTLFPYTTLFRSAEAGAMFTVPAALPRPNTVEFGPRLISTASRIEGSIDRKSTRLNSSHTDVYTLSLHDALPICGSGRHVHRAGGIAETEHRRVRATADFHGVEDRRIDRSEEHTSELQSH